jgi:hypothetical protein
MFEYENDLLIVDEAIIDPSLPTAIVVKIKDSYFLISHTEMGLSNKPIKEISIRPYLKKVNENWMRMDHNYELLFAGMIPRGGFSVDLGRPITADELKDLCVKYNLTDSEISKEFEDKKGAIYGKYAKIMKSIQIKVPDNEAIGLETELISKGIEAGNGSTGRVNIRTDWGGYREGSGRKATGRKLTRIYITEEEEQKLREYLDKIRNS